MVKELLQLFIGKVNAKLFKTVVLLERNDMEIRHITGSVRNG